MFRRRRQERQAARRYAARDAGSDLATGGHARLFRRRADWRRQHHDADADPWGLVSRVEPHASTSLSFDKLILRQAQDEAFSVSLTLSLSKGEGRRLSKEAEPC